MTTRPDDEEPLHGGNVAVGVVRVGDTVRRPAGPHTPAVHALLAHLHGVGFRHAPLPPGFDEQGREVLSYLPGWPVHPDHRDLIDPDRALVETSGGRPCSAEDPSIRRRGSSPPGTFG